jgi:hypothetical protein
MGPQFDVGPGHGQIEDAPNAKQYANQLFQVQVTGASV